MSRRVAPPENPAPVGSRWERLYPADEDSPARRGIATVYRAFMDRGEWWVGFHTELPGMPGRQGTGLAAAHVVSKWRRIVEEKLPWPKPWWKVWCECAALGVGHTLGVRGCEWHETEGPRPRPLVPTSLWRIFIGWDRHDRTSHYMVGPAVPWQIAALSLMDRLRAFQTPEECDHCRAQAQESMEKLAAAEPGTEFTEGFVDGDEFLIVPAGEFDHAQAWG